MDDAASRLNFLREDETQKPTKKDDENWKKEEPKP